MVMKMLKLCSVLVAVMLGSHLTQADDAFEVWDMFPESKDPYYSTGRRRRMLIRPGEKPEDYPVMRRDRMDEEGVTWPCLVEPFKGTSTYLYDVNHELLSSSSQEKQTQTYKEEVEGEKVPENTGDKDGESETSSQEVEEKKPMHTCSMAYGGVILNYTKVPLNGKTVAKLLQHIPTEIPSLSLEMLAEALQEAKKNSDEATNEAVEFKEEASDVFPGVVGKVKVVAASRLDLKFTDDDGATQIAVELATRTARFVAPVNVGVLFYLELAVGEKELHKVGISLTRTNHLSVFQHIFHDKDILNKKTKVANDTKTTSESYQEKEKEEKGKSMRKGLKLMTYNLWNVNPPTYVYKDNRERWERYNQRINHFVKIIQEANPDVLAVQEVRHDDNFGPLEESSGEYGHKFKLATSESSQIRHLMKRLEPLGYHQYVYQPAMLYYSPPGGGSFSNMGGLREEEGTAIISKFPIVSSDYLLMPRDKGDGEDSHQRAILHAQVLVPHWSKSNIKNTKNTVNDDSVAHLLDVYSTHMSLSERARNRGVRHLIEYANKGTGTSQVIMGDLNAEPHEPAMKYLVGEVLDEKDNMAVTIDSGGGETTDSMLVQSNDKVNHQSQQGFFTDLWLALHKEPTPGSKDQWELDHALTFPTCNPVKRIDYVLFRDKESTTEDERFKVVSCDVIGQHPVEGAQYETRDGLGMLDTDSPVWGSDHRAVVAVIEPL